MVDHRHNTHHHHHPGDVHPPAAVSASILRLSALHRLSISAVLVVLVWVTAFWAMQ
jgi:hypothetical protein